MSRRDFMAEVYSLSSRSLRDMSVRLRDDVLEIGLKAYQDFKPIAFQGAIAILDVLTDEGPRELRGTLDVIHSIFPRKPWFHYRFVPDAPHEIFFILDRDGLWSNVSKVKLVSPHGSLELKNPFSFEPFDAVPV